MLSTITRMIRTNAAVHAVDEGLARHARGDVGVVGEHRSVAMRESNGFRFTPVVIPTAMSSGAVSPITRAIARVIPEAMPAIAVG